MTELSAAGWWGYAEANRSLVGIVVIVVVVAAILFVTRRWWRRR
jgi:inner membrane protein involved in colicin E2 resistance